MTVQNKTNENTSIWKNHTWIRMFTAYTISTFGDWLDMMAIFVLLAYTWNADPILIALVPITFALPGILLGSFAGVLADRWEKINIMIAVDFLSAILTGLLIFANSIYLVFPILLLRSTAGIFLSPAEQALTRSVVHEELLLKATSFNQLVNQIAKIAGPLIGGLIVSFLSVKISLLINTISFIIAGLILLTIRNVKEESSTDINGETNSSFRESWKEGWIFILKNKIILYTLMIGFIGTLVIQLVDNQFPVLFRTIAPDNPSLIGWTISLVGLGSVISISILNKIKNLRYGWTIGFGTFLLGIGFSGIGMLTSGFNMALLIVLSLVAGIGNGLWMVTFNYILQSESPKEIVGRVFGILNVMTSIVFIVSPLTGGLIIHYMGPTQIFQWVGWFVIVLGIAVIILRNKLYPHNVTTMTKGGVL